MKNNINKHVMAKLKLKNEYLGVVITRNKLGVGTLTFDSSNVEEAAYENYAKLGFDDLFYEEIEPEMDSLEKVQKQVIDYQGVEQPKLNKKKK